MHICQKLLNELSKSLK